MSSNLTQTISRAIKRMSAAELGDLLADITAEFGISVTIPDRGAPKLKPGWIPFPVRPTPEMIRAASGYSWTTHTVDIHVRNMLSDVVAAVPSYPEDE